MDWKKLLICTSAFAVISTMNFAYAQDTTQGNDSITFDHTTKVTGANPNNKNSKLTTAEIGTLATVAVIDKFEVLVSVVANNKNPSSGVADFAKMMIDQHGNNLNQILEMVNGSHITALKGGESEKMKTETMKDLMKLGEMQGGQAFEKAYVDAMVIGHQGALNLIDTKLMATAKSEEMKKFMIATRAAVAHHLEMAKQLQTSMQS